MACNSTTELRFSQRRHRFANLGLPYIADKSQGGLLEEDTVAWISCLVEDSSTISTWLESQSNHRPPERPIELAIIASSIGSLSTIRLALSPHTLVSMMIMIAREWIRTISLILLQKIGLKAPWQFQINVFIITQERNLNRTLIGRIEKFTSLFNLHICL